MQEVSEAALTGYTYVLLAMLGLGVLIVVIWLVGILFQVMDHSDGGHTVIYMGRPATSRERLLYYAIWPWQVARWFTTNRKHHTSVPAEKQL